MMAELGALANLAGVIGAGLQLSMVLYDFASTIGSAGKDIKAVACEISLLCRVLKQVQLMLSKAKAFRILIGAIQTTQDILDRCLEIFNELESVLKKLKKDDSSSADIFTRVKWAFKRSRILVQKQSLTSCAATLHLMISTLDFAQRIATRPKSISNAEVDAQDEQDRIMTSSLLLAQQSINERLEDLEDRCDAEAARNPSPQPSADQSLSTVTLGQDLASRHRRNKSSQSSFGSPLAQSPMSSHVAGQRASLLLNTHLFGREFAALSSRLSRTSLTDLGDRRQSILQSNVLLQSWTDQSDPLAESAAEESEQDEEAETNSHRITERRSTDMSYQPGNPSRRFSLSPGTGSTEDWTGSAPRQDQPADYSSYYSSSQTAVTADIPPIENSITVKEASGAAYRDVPGEDPTPTKEASDDPVTTTESPEVPHSPQTAAANAEPSVEIFKSFRVGQQDRCYKVLPAALRRYQIQADWRCYSLYIVYGDFERCIALHEYPLAIFKELDKKGLKPMFMLRKINWDDKDWPSIYNEKGYQRSGMEESKASYPEITEWRPGRNRTNAPKAETLPDDKIPDWAASGLQL